MDRFAFVVFSVLVLGACTAFEARPFADGSLTMLGDCRTAPPGGWSHCSARNRPWSDRLQP
jgi:hypothetical protein